MLSSFQPPKFWVERVAPLPPTNHASSQKARLNNLLYGIKIHAELFFCFVKIDAFDRQTEEQTDGQTAFS